MSAPSTSPAVYQRRIDRVREEMVARDLPYLTGYLAMPLERLTMLVLTRDADATLLVPELEAPRVVEQPGVFTLHPWGELTDPIELVAKLAAGASRVAVG